MYTNRKTRVTATYWKYCLPLVISTKGRDLITSWNRIRSPT